MILYTTDSLIGRVKMATQPLEVDFPLFPEISDQLILILLYSIFIASYFASARVAIMTTKRPPTMPPPSPPQTTHFEFLNTVHSIVQPTS